MRRRSQPLLHLAAAWVAACAAACAWPSDVERFATPEERLELLSTSPAHGDTAAPAARIDLCFSRLADPRTLGAFDVTLSSGGVIFDVDVDLQIFAWRPPTGEELGEAPWCPGSVVSIRPRTPLVTGILYRVRLRPSLRGWAGELLDVTTPGWQPVPGGEAAFTLEWTPGPPSEPEGEAEPPRTLRELFAPGGVLDPARGLCGCHREPYGLASELLPLRAPQEAFDALVLPTALRSTGYRMVAPHRPSESFLIHKLLRDDDDVLDFVHGSAMPLPGPLPYRDLVEIARWIEDGALY
ncbi:MAG: hypothetical protein IPK80_10690 [Nannocystis sp.]|nr:hypothetical protein [Nannocystis sp.]